MAPQHLSCTVSSRFSDEYRCRLPFRQELRITMVTSGMELSGCRGDKGIDELVLDSRHSAVISVTIE